MYVYSNPSVNVFRRTGIIIAYLALLMVLSFAEILLFILCQFCTSAIHSSLMDFIYDKLKSCTYYINQETI